MLLWFALPLVVAAALTALWIHHGKWSHQEPSPAEIQSVSSAKELQARAKAKELKLDGSTANDQRDSHQPQSQTGGQSVPNSAEHLSAIPPPAIAQADMLVGAYYFPGWDSVEKWYCVAANDKVQHPLLGYYQEGNPDAADWHIKWALEHGIAFFAFDFYTEDGVQHLGKALNEGFLKARFIGQFRFCLNWCPISTVGAKTAREMDLFGDQVISRYLTHPSYLRIDGKPVVMILAGYDLVKNLGVENAKSVFEHFERRCKEAGLGGVYLVFGDGNNDDTTKFVKMSRAAGANVFCVYNYPYIGSGLSGPGTHKEASYADLVERAEKSWREWRTSATGRFWPTVMSGWDRRPWQKSADLIRTGTTPELFAKSLRMARNYVNQDRVVMIEAWNEWGEGSALEPSVETGFAYLDQVRAAFCPSAGPHQDGTPKFLGLREPVFPLKLPDVDNWTFDFDHAGWTPKGTTGFRAESGYLRFTTSTDDPQILSPWTFLDCATHAHVQIRMRASGDQSQPFSVGGQFFWSTIDEPMTEKTSVTFPVPLDGQWHNYDLPLASSPYWRGRTDRLRLDPVNRRGVAIDVDEIRLPAHEGVGQ